MRWLSTLALSACLLAGCSRTKSATVNPALPPGDQPAPVKSPVTNRSGLIVTPGGSVKGRVASVNASARFVVVGFPFGSVPAIGKRLSVYRNGLKIGELKITGPQRENNIVADIVTGECQLGDDVRED